MDANLRHGTLASLRKEVFIKFLRVNMVDKTINVEKIPKKYIGLGGRGLTSVMINEEVPPTCNPLGPDNKLIFAIGLLTGTTFVNTSRISVGAKSPLTSTIKESNAGGTIGTALGHLGIISIIFEGKASKDELYLLRIDDKGYARLEDASDYRGFHTYRLVEALQKKYGKKNGIMCIGPAGEARMALASIQSSDMDGRPCRAAARGGLGAVMGSKGLKAIMVDQRGKNSVSLLDPLAFKEAAKAFAKAVKEHPMSGQMMPALGTAGLIAPVNSMGAFPCYNAASGVLKGWEKISGEVMARMIAERKGNTSHIGCSQCIVRCSNVYNDKDFNFVTGSLEYETIWSMGGMTGITNLDKIARLDFLCDDIGIDTMSTGVAIAVAMDAGYAKFGDASAAMRIVEEIGKGNDLGRLFGSGPSKVGAKFGNKRIPVVKGQSIAGYDPRAMQGNGVTYATCPMGADHTAGNVIGEYMEGKLDALKTKGQVEASRNTQIAIAAVDCTGLCLFASLPLVTPEGGKAFIKAMNARFGKSMGPDLIPELGLRVIRAEREFNLKAGFTNDDDRLPKFFYEEPLPPHNKVFQVSDEDLDNTFKLV